MAKGQRGDHGRDVGQETPITSPKRELSSPTRCPECGGLVYAPCRLCRARTLQARMLAARRLELNRTPQSRRAA
jgi:hypothetical protein